MWVGDKNVLSFKAYSCGKKDLFNRLAFSAIMILSSIGMKRLTINDLEDLMTEPVSKMSGLGPSSVQVSGG